MSDRDVLSQRQVELCETADTDYSDLRALFINCTLKRSPEVSNTQGLMDISEEIMRRNGVEVDSIRAIDHEIAVGVWPDMTEHGWEVDEWPQIFERVMAADILVLGMAIWLGEKSSVATHVIERLYGNSHLLNDAGQYAYYGRVGGCLVTGNEDGIKHCALETLYALQHLGYTIPPQADAGWIGEAGPGPSYLDEGSGGPENDFTNRNTTFMTWNLLHLARLLKDAGGIPAHGNQRTEWDAGAASTSRTPSTGREHGIECRPHGERERRRRRAGRVGTETGDKGLKTNAIGFLDGLSIGLASTAPAYSLAAVIGSIVVAVGVKAPAILLLSFVPMFFIAAAFYYMNRVDTDCGTTFSWVTRALGPYAGWIGGWAICTTGILVIGSLADVSALFLFDLLELNDLRKSALANVGAGDRRSSS